MQQTLETMVATRHWIAQMLGNWEQEDVSVVNTSAHKLPPEVLAQIPNAWEERMRQFGNEIGEEGKDWRIKPVKPYAHLEIRTEVGWTVRMFAGDQTRIEKYQQNPEGTVTLTHSPTNYAASLATNNTDPWGLIRKYGGRTALADGHHVTVGLTAKDENGREAMQLLKREKELAEYGGYTGTIAGSSLTPNLTPFDIAYRLSLQEAGILPTLNSEEYKRIGLSSSSLEEIEKVQGGTKVRFTDRRGKEAQALLLPQNTLFTMIGLALNVDPDDYDKADKNKPHHKSEYLFLVRTNMPTSVLDDPSAGWARDYQHKGSFYVPIPELRKLAVEDFRTMLPPTSAVILAMIRALYGQDAFNKTLQAVNAQHPIGDDHPLVEAVREGRYALPELITK